MKQFKTVFLHELKMMCCNKVFIGATAFLAIIVAAAMIIGTFVIVGLENEDTSDNSTIESEEIFLINDENKVIKSYDVLSIYFSGAKFEYVEDYNDIEDMMATEEYVGAFIISDASTFEYIVYNSNIFDSNAQIFSSALASIITEQSLIEAGYDVEEVYNIMNNNPQYTTTILNVDGFNNYFSVYILVFIIYMAIIFYGMQIATSITSEKSNRSIEMLVTSANPNSLIFGKILAAVSSCLMQLSVVAISLYSTYAICASKLNHMLDPYLYPGFELTIAFIAFGISGFLLSGFFHGAAGAMVSKTEDLNKVQMPMMIGVIGAFICSMTFMGDSGSLPMVIASYFPFTSYLCMFVRLGMGTAGIIEALISLAILIATTGLMGIVTAKIYRLGTIQYGNVLKWSTTIKYLFKGE